VLIFTQLPRFSQGTHFQRSPRHYLRPAVHLQHPQSCKQAQMLYNLHCQRGTWFCAESIAMGTLGCWEDSKTISPNHPVARSSSLRLCRAFGELHHTSRERTKVGHWALVFWNSSRLSPAYHRGAFWSMKASHPADRSKEGQRKKGIPKAGCGRSRTRWGTTSLATMSKDRCLSHSLCHRVYMLDVQIRD
jgi:hypothetical protein